MLLSQHVETRHSLDLVGHRRLRLPAQGPGARRGRLPRRTRRVADGGSALDPEVVAALVSGRRDDPLAALTPREREVLALMAEGRTNAGIARRLWLTDRTVETHVRSIMGKLGMPAHRRGPPPRAGRAGPSARRRRARTPRHHVARSRARHDAAPRRRREDRSDGSTTTSEES